MATASRWFTISEVAAYLHLSRRSVWRLLGPYREHLHLARLGRHPRQLTFVPSTIVRRLISERPWLASGVPLIRDTQ